MSKSFYFLGAIKAVAISPNSKYFASASFDKTIRVYRTCDVELLHVLEGNIFNEMFFLIIHNDILIQETTSVVRRETTVGERPPVFPFSYFSARKFSPFR